MPRGQFHDRGDEQASGTLAEGVAPATPQVGALGVTSRLTARVVRAARNRGGSPSMTSSVTGFASSKHLLGQRSIGRLRRSALVLTQGHVLR
jgi:hypothetical protein